MVNKVSDFQLAEAIIKKICMKEGVLFVDAPIDFDGSNESALQIGDTKNVAHTIYKIVSEYISNGLSIVGKDILPDIRQREDLLLVISSNLRYFFYKDGDEDLIDSPFAIRLYQHPLVWIMLKDIVSPVFDVDMSNIQIIYGNNSKIDIARFCSKDENDKVSEDFIFVNNLNNDILQNIFIFIESLKSLGLSPIEVVKNIYESDLYDKFHGLLEISLLDESVNDFECGLLVILGIDFKELLGDKMAMSDSNFVKMAQNLFPGVNNQFWSLGILEQMLEPIRGQNDWSVYHALEPYVKEFWDKVEEIKEKRLAMGKDPGVPFDQLLRLKSVQTVGYKIDPSRTMETLLSSDRVW